MDIRRNKKKCLNEINFQSLAREYNTHIVRKKKTKNNNWGEKKSIKKSKPDYLREKTITF